jgi:hypothetical protein
MTKQEAMRLLSERKCDVEVVRESGILDYRGVVEGKDCRDKWPGQPSEWCVLCIAREALEDVPNQA